MSANCRHYDILSNRGEFIWEQTINRVQNFIVRHKSDLLCKAISLNRNKPELAAKLISLDRQTFFLNLTVANERARTLFHIYKVETMVNLQIETV